MLSIDMSSFMDSMMTWAASMFNNLIPVFGVLIGISLGIGLLFLVYKVIKDVVPHA